MRKPGQRIALRRAISQLKSWPIVQVLVVLFASLAVMTVPGFPHELDPDFAWNRVLNFAHQQGWQFGPELVFTYGPLGFLLSPDFAPHAFGLRLSYEIALCITIASGLCLVAWRLPLGSRVLVLLFFVWSLANIHPRADLLLYVGLCCWGLLCLAERGERLLLYVVILALLAAFAAMVKLSLMVMGVLTVGVVAVDMCLRGCWKMAGTLLAASLVSALLDWMASGQHLLNLFKFFWPALGLVRDYDQTMGLEGLPALRTWGILALAPALVAVLIYSWKAWDGEVGSLNWRRGAFLAWGLALLLMTWKHGFVMNGLYHAGFFFGFVPVLVLSLDMTVESPSKARTGARVSALVACLVVIGALQALVFPGGISSLAAPLVACKSNLAVLLHPTEYYRSMVATENAIHQAYALPKLANRIQRATVDVFGLEPHCALFNRFNYHPRPVFQSYSAYNAPLMRLNEEFFLSKRAPEFVLFDFNPVERRFPPLEDAMVLRALLMNYEPVDSERAFLLLQLKSRNPARLTLVRQGDVRIGAPIELQDQQGSRLWIEIEIKPTLLGRIRRLFYRPPIVRLLVKSDPENPRPVRFQAPAPMLAAGFIANPVLTRREDVLRLYRGEPLPQASAYSVEVGRGSEAFWNDTIHFRLYRIEQDDRDGALPSGAFQG